jgi:hypothetical protein
MSTRLSARKRHHAESQTSSDDSGKLKLEPLLVRMDAQESVASGKTGETRARIGGAAESLRRRFEAVIIPVEPPEGSGRPPKHQPAEAAIIAAQWVERKWSRMRKGDPQRMNAVSSWDHWWSMAGTRVLHAGLRPTSKPAALVRQLYCHGRFPAPGTGSDLRPAGVARHRPGAGITASIAAGCAISSLACPPARVLTCAPAMAPSQSWPWKPETD